LKREFQRAKSTTTSGFKVKIMGFLVSKSGLKDLNPDGVF